ncbi:MAG TPA: chemotaxis protein CheB [Nitrospira sp.]|nr:chemotaxis protein CheB [Nitrospira sp.]
MQGVAPRKAPVPQRIRDIVVIGASAGGVETLETIVAGLPADFPAAVCVVLHIQSSTISRLPAILSQKGPLPARHPTDGSPVRKGLIYVAPPNQHLLIKDGHIQLSAGPKEHRTRPAINPLFRSAALAYGPRVIGVVLTGTLDDGTAGLWEIKQHGGTTVVQDPSDARFPDMPRNALEQVPIDHVMPVGGIASLLTDLVGQPINIDATEEDVMKAYQWTDLTCPECRGPIRQSGQSTLKEYRCRVGHRYSPETYVAAEAETRERTLWQAILSLEEAAEVMKELAQSKPRDKRRLQHAAENNLQAARKIRELREWLTKEESRDLIEEADDQSRHEDPGESAA